MIKHWQRIFLIMLIAAVIFIHPNSLGTLSIAAQTQQGEIILASAKGYESADENSAVIKEFAKNEIVIVVSETEKFYEVQLEENTCYVLKAYIYIPTADEIIRLPEFNATIKQNTDIFELVDGKYISIGRLAKDTKVKIISGFNNKSRYTEISVYLDSGKVVNGFCLTEMIRPKGINPGLITGITLLITCSAIVLILFGVGIFKRKKRGK